MSNGRETTRMFGLSASRTEADETREEKERRLFAKIADLMRQNRELGDEVRRARAAADPATLRCADALAAEAKRVVQLETQNRELASRLMLVEGGFHAAKDAIIIADPFGRVVDANRAAVAMFGELAGTDVKTTVLERVQEPIVRSTEDSSVGRSPLPYGYKLWERVNLNDAPREFDRAFREGVEENVEIKTVENRSVDVKLSMYFVRDRNDHPLQLYVTVTNIEAAFRDSLTNLWGRRTLAKALDRKIGERERAVADGRVPNPLAVMVADIDHFKKVNDTYGHLAGDKAIRHVAAMLSGQFQRATDLVARYGGEEFVVVMDMPIDGANESAERFRRAMESSYVRVKDGPRFQVTISVGLSDWRPGMDPKDLIGEADAQLYRSKNGGRNRVSSRIRALTPPTGYAALKSSGS